MYCVIELQGKQYKVEPGKPVLVDRLDAEQNSEIAIDRVLLYRDDGKGVKVGTPYVKGMKLKAKVLENVMGKKKRVFTYKKRKDVRRTIGSRPYYTKIVVEKPGE